MNSAASSPTSSSPIKPMGGTAVLRKCETFLHVSSAVTGTGESLGESCYTVAIWDGGPGKGECYVTASTQGLQDFVVKEEEPCDDVSSSDSSSYFSAKRTLTFRGA